MIVISHSVYVTEIASEGLKGRVFEVSLADLQKDENAERSFRKFRLIAEDVQGTNVLTNFHGMDLTTDKLRSMVKKWQVCYYLQLYQTKLRIRKLQYRNFHVFRL